jgi:hypothetical protein
VFLRAFGEIVLRYLHVSLGSLSIAVQLVVDGVRSLT